MSVFPPSNDVSSIPTYAASTGASYFTLSGTATDIAIINGSASKTVEILKVFARMLWSSGNYWVEAFLNKRTVANSGGTSSTLSAIPFDSNNAAATAVVKRYTANPTLGAGSIILPTIIPCTTGGWYWPQAEDGISTIYDSEKFGQPIVLRGVAQGLAINLNGAPPASTSATVGFIWRER